MRRANADVESWCCRRGCSSERLPHSSRGKTPRGRQQKTLPDGLSLQTPEQPSRSKPLTQRQTNCTRPAIASLSLYLASVVPSHSGTEPMDAYTYLTGQALRYQCNHGGETNVRDVWLIAQHSQMQAVGSERLRRARTRRILRTAR